MCETDPGMAMQIIAAFIGAMAPTIIAFMTALAALIGACVAVAREVRLWLRRPVPTPLPAQPTNRSLAEMCAATVRGLFHRRPPPSGKS